MAAKTKPAPKAKTDKPAKGEGKAKKESTRPTEVPKYLDKDGKILLVENDKGRKVPVKFKGKDFPTGVAGHQAFCDYNIALWVWKREAKTAKGGSVDRRQKRLDKLREQIAQLEKELGSAATA